MNELSLANFSLFTHSGCMDGSAAAILFVAAGGKSENVRFVPAGEVDEVLSESSVIRNPNRQILLVDIAPRSDETVHFLDGRGGCVVIDHHSTSSRLSGHPGYLIDVHNSACGCENFRRWLVRCGMERFDEHPWRRFTQIIDDHDRWVLREPMAIEMPRFFAFAGQQEFVRMFSNVEERFVGQRERYWTQEEEALLQMIQRSQERRFRKLSEQFIVTTLEFEGKMLRVAYIISGEVNCSELLNDYLSSHIGVDVACQISIDGNRVSLRSRAGEVDVAKLASRFGGGGHPAASGHPLPKGLVDLIIKETHKCQS